MGNKPSGTIQVSRWAAGLKPRNLKKIMRPCWMERQTDRECLELVMRLNRLRKQIKILNWGSDGCLILKRPELIREVWRFAARSLMKGRHVAASPESWYRTKVLWEVNAGVLAPRRNEWQTPATVFGKSVSRSPSLKKKESCNGREENAGWATAWSGAAQGGVCQSWKCELLSEQDFERTWS